MRRSATLLLAIAALAGCSSSGGAAKPLVGNDVLALTSRLTLSAAGLVEGAAALAAIHFIYDPLAPNWEIEESRLADDTFRFSLRMKRYQTGGAGESIQIVKRRALQLQGELGYAEYQLVGYSEGIDSETFGARRVAEGTVKLVQRRAANALLSEAR